MDTIFWGHWAEIQEDVNLRARSGAGLQCWALWTWPWIWPCLREFLPRVMSSCCHLIPLWALGLHSLLGKPLGCPAFCLSILVSFCHAGQAEAFPWREATLWGSRLVKDSACATAALYNPPLHFTLWWRARACNFSSKGNFLALLSCTCFYSARFTSGQILSFAFCICLCRITQV